MDQDTLTLSPERGTERLITSCCETDEFNHVKSKDGKVTRTVCANCNKRTELKKDIWDNVLTNTKDIGRLKTYVKTVNTSLGLTDKIQKKIKEQLAGADAQQRDSIRNLKRTVVGLIFVVAAVLGFLISTTANAQITDSVQEQFTDIVDDMMLGGDWQPSSDMFWINPDGTTTVVDFSTKSEEELNHIVDSMTTELVKAEMELKEGREAANRLNKIFGGLDAEIAEFDRIILIIDPDYFVRKHSKRL